MKKRVLIIEDESDYSAAVSKRLRANNFQCSTAISAELGLERAAKLKPHLILLDLMLPRMSGLGFLREIKKNPDLSKIPVVILTALSYDEDVLEEVMDLGAVGYLSKTCTFNELVFMVKEYAESRVSIE